MAPFGIDFAASLPTLCLGISFFFWIPLCVAFGRRPVLLTAALMMAGATMGAGFAPGFHQLLVALGFIGFAAGAPLGMVSLAVLSLFCVIRPGWLLVHACMLTMPFQSLLQIIDLTFIHERPLALAAYWSLPSVVALIPLAELPGMLDAALEWRKPYRVIGLTTLILALLIFLFVPETYFLRPPVALDGRVLVQSGTEKIQVYDEVREVPANNSNTHNTMAGLDSTLPVDLDALPLTVHSWRVSPLFRVGPAARGVDLRAAFACFVQVFLVLGNPLVFWLALLNAVNFGAMMCIGVGFPVVLSKPPYSLPPAAVGRINDSAALGSLLALPAAYFLLNNVTKALTRRNRGVRHAEFYLPAFVLPVVSGAASVLLYGFAAARGWSPVWYHVSYGINSFSYVSGGIANTVWATESLPQWAAPAIAVVGGASYAASWGISGILEPWEASWGIEPVAIALGIATGIVGLGAIPLAFWGKSVRQYISGHWGAYQPGALRPQTRQVE